MTPSDCSCIYGACPRSALAPSGLCRVHLEDALPLDWWVGRGNSLDILLCRASHAASARPTPDQEMAAHVRAHPGHVSVGVGTIHDPPETYEPSRCVTCGFPSPPAP